MQIQSDWSPYVFPFFAVQACGKKLFLRIVPSVLSLDQRGQRQTFLVFRKTSPLPARSPSFLLQSQSCSSQLFSPIFRLLSLLTTQTEKNISPTNNQSCLSLRGKQRSVWSCREFPAALRFQPRALGWPEGESAGDGAMCVAVVTKQYSPSCPNTRALAQPPLL